MRFSSKDEIFDTLVDTKKIYVSMKTKFIPRNYVKGDGTSPLYLHITSNYKRERVDLKINVDIKYWDSTKERLKPVNNELKDINLIIDNVESKLTAIKTAYRLSERVLTPLMMKKELASDMPRVNFISFYKNSLEEEKIFLEKGTYRKHLSVVRKMESYQSEVTFLDLDLDWLDNYKKYLKKKGNKLTTINTNLASIKKFLGIAQKHGIKLRVNLDEIKVGTTKGNRTALNHHELKILCKYYFSEFINPSYRLILGYFLYSCMTGMRISDVQNLSRKNFNSEYVTFVSKKTKKDQSIQLNKLAKSIIEHEPFLFETKFSNEHINDELKKIMRLVGITKHISFHVARHTFATTYLRAGGSVEKLRLLLGHSDIKQTMIYVGIVALEANDDIFRIDDYLK